MTTRDRIVVLVVLGTAMIAGFWFVVLSPKREEATKLDAKVAVVQQRLQTAQNTLGQAEKARRGYEADYAAVARLGKAVPKDDNMPSLLYQLQDAARGARIDFRSAQISGASQSAAPAASSGGSSASSGSTTAAPATQAAAAALPPGASVGSAGFPTMPFQFTFRGSFFDMEHLLNEVQDFISVDGKDVRVRGRLLTIDAIALSPQTFPEVKASITATAYLLPADDATVAGATPQSPAASSSGDQSASSPSAPKVTTPSATATGAAG